MPSLSCVSVSSRRALKDLDAHAPPQTDLYPSLLECDLGINCCFFVFFFSHPGDAGVQLGLRCTVLVGRDGG